MANDCNRLEAVWLRHIAVVNHDRRRLRRDAHRFDPGQLNND